MIGATSKGPFLSPLRLGAHPVSARRDPDAALLERLLAAGPVSEMTLAPELDGALELIDLAARPRRRRVVRPLRRDRGGGRAARSTAAPRR